MGDSEFASLYCLISLAGIGKMGILSDVCVFIRCIAIYISPPSPKMSDGLSLLISEYDSPVKQLNTKASRTRDSVELYTSTFIRRLISFLCKKLRWVCSQRSRYPRKGFVVIIPRLTAKVTICLNAIIYSQVVFTLH